MCPLLFHGLAMSSPNTSRVIERIVCLAWCAVTRKVEFGDMVRKFELLHFEIWVILGETLEKMD